jgi:hypothetical protein
MRSPSTTNGVGRPIRPMTGDPDGVRTAAGLDEARGETPGDVAGVVDADAPGDAEDAAADGIALGAAPEAAGAANIGDWGGAALGSLVAGMASRMVPAATKVMATTVMNTNAIGPDRSPRRSVRRGSR